MEVTIKIFKQVVQYLRSTYSSKRFLGGSYYQLLFLGFLLIVSFTVWRMDFSFFYWDEWDWLKDIVGGNFNIWEPHNEHFLPIMKIFYWLQITLFDADPLLMHYIMLIIHTIVTFLFGFLLWLIFRKNLFSIIGSIAFLIHPFQWDNLLWNFQSQIILNVGLFLLSLIFVKLFFDRGKQRYFYLSCISIFLQAYCFGNGLILPLVVIAFFFLFRDKKYSFKYYLSYIAIFALNLVLYMFFGSENITSHTGGYSLSDIPKIMNYFANAVFYNIARSLTFLGQPPLWIVCLISAFFLLFLVWVLMEDFKKRGSIYKVLIFGVWFYLICFSLISLTRFRLGSGQSFASRYAYYYLIPVIISVLCFVKYMSPILYKKKIYLATVISLTLLFSILAGYKDWKQKREVESRNRKNYQELIRYDEDPTYDPDLSHLHPFQTKEEILQSSKYLELLDLQMPD